MLKIIADEHGEDLANLVADQLNLHLDPPPNNRNTQRLSIPTRDRPCATRSWGRSSGRWSRPDRGTRSARRPLAKQVGMSTRQLERLFRRYLIPLAQAAITMEIPCGTGQGAQNLLMQTDMSVINVALACGLRLAPRISRNCYRGALRHHPLPRARDRTGRAKRPEGSRLGHARLAPAATGGGVSWGAWPALSYLRRTIFILRVIVGRIPRVARQQVGRSGRRAGRYGPAMLSAQSTRSRAAIRHR